jgi:hypothetical protein
VIDDWTAFTGVLAVAGAVAWALYALYTLGAAAALAASLDWDPALQLRKGHFVAVAVGSLSTFAAIVALAGVLPGLS